MNRSATFLVVFAALFAVGQVEGSAVVGRYIYYNDSTFDGNDPGSGVADDGAIAPDKTALLPGGTATFSNYTSYSRGITGIMVDIAGLPGAPATADFAFSTGNANNVFSWPSATPPSDVSVRVTQGVGGSDRVTIIWPDGAIQKEWLEITVLANATTGLLADDVFYFGNAIGESGNSAIDAIVSQVDRDGAEANPHDFLDPALIDDVYDFNRDARVDPVDVLIAENNYTDETTALQLITPIPESGSLSLLALGGLLITRRRR